MYSNLAAFMDVMVFFGVPWLFYRFLASVIDAAAKPSDKV